MYNSFAVSNTGLLGGGYLSGSSFGYLGGSNSIWGGGSVISTSVINPCENQRMQHTFGVTRLYELGRRLSTFFAASLSESDRQALGLGLSAQAINWLNQIQNFNPNGTAQGLENSPAYQLALYLSTDLAAWTVFTQVVSNSGICAIKGAIAAYVAAIISPSLPNSHPLRVFVAVLVEGMSVLQGLGLGASNCTQFYHMIGSDMGIDFTIFDGAGCVGSLGLSNIFVSRTASVTTRVGARWV